METEAAARRATPEPLPANIRSVQPGGGVCYEIELAWGRMRRWYLKRFRPGYVKQMAELRTGSSDGCLHEVLDPRDLKYCRNLCTARWSPERDPFTWRGRLPFARWGLAELQLLGWPLAALTVAVTFLPGYWQILAVAPGIALGLVVYFFRDPPRRVPTDAGTIVSPADGTVVDVTQVDDAFVGRAMKIGIFLSIFNVHINRAPERCRVVKLGYKPGEFLNALNPQSVERNESLWIGLEEESPPHRRMVVRQISGLIARRIVCQLRPGEIIERGEPFGMIKLGSRTELIVPAEGFCAAVEPGKKVHAGSTVIGHYQN